MKCRRSSSYRIDAKETALNLPISCGKNLSLAERQQGAAVLSKASGGQTAAVQFARTSLLDQEGRDGDGRKTFLAFVISEQKWIAESVPERGVKRGDIVVDVGAHIRAFADDALRRGAATWERSIPVWAAYTRSRPT